MKNTRVIFLLNIILFSASADIKKFDPEQVFAKLSLRKKIAQLCIVAAVSHEEKNKKLMERWQEWASYQLDHAYVEDLIKNHHIGGVIFYGSNTTAPEQATLTAHFQSVSDTPLFIALDAETCLHNRMSEVLEYPCAMALGAVRDPREIYKLGAELAEQLKAIGVHIAFSPVVDVNDNPENPIIGLRAFGSEKSLVALMGLALMNGLQSKGIIACAKHFPGHGDTSKDSHQELPEVHQDLEIALYPFQKLIDAGIKSVMLAHLEVPALEKQKGLASSLSYEIATRLLQQKMGFRGLVITDALGMKGATDCAQPGQLELQALKAGNDILLCPVDAAKAIDYIEQAVKEGKISEEEINKKVMKVLHAKAWAFSQARNSSDSLEEILNSRHAQELQETLFSKAITLAKKGCPNPFAQSNEKRMMIAVHAKPDKSTAHDIFGSEMPAFDISKEEELSPDLFKTITNSQHIMIAIHTMNRFANENYGIPNEILNCIDALKEDGKQVTVILYGTPYAIPLLKNADNILVAYENWPAAHKAVADIICGKKTASGILPVKIR